MELFGTAIGGVAMFTLIIMSLVAIILIARSRLVSSGDVTIHINDDLNEMKTSLLIHNILFDLYNITYDIMRAKTHTPVQENDVNSLADTIQKWLSQNLHSREAIRQFAYQTIDTKWNLYYQMNILKQVFLKQAKDE